VVRSNPGAVQGIKQFDSDEQRLLFCSSLEKVNCFMVKPVYSEKDLEAAKKLKDEGNNAFQKKWYKQAHSLYSTSMVKSPCNNDTYAYSMANRSACNYYLGEAQHCIADIDIALKSGYPPQLHYKLFERLAKSYVLLKDRPNALKAVQRAKDSLEKNRSKFDKDKYKSMREKLVKLGIVINNKDDTLLDNIELAEEEPQILTPSVSKKPHKKIPEFSNIIKVEHDEKVGRHVRAEKCVKAGDTLVVEEPLAAVLYPNRYGTNCNYCFGKLRNVIACPYCAGVGFCSVQCRDIALSTYHRY
jgi:tetratricopeptide (TPR) repeat protein